MTTRIVPIILAMFLQSCGKTDNQPFAGLFNGEITPAMGGTNGGNGGGSGIQVSSTTTMSSASSSPVAVGNLNYDGTRLLVVDTAGGWPIINNVSYDYFSTSLTFQSHSTTNYSAGVWEPVTAPGPLAGQSALYWAENGSSNIYLTVRDDSNGTLQSTTAINFSNYGCNSNATFTYCGSDYYGVCTTGAGCGGFGCMRFFSFDSSGTMQSAVTTNISTLSDIPSALACYNGSDLLLVTNHNSGSYNAFYKYDLSFSLIATDSNTSSSFPTGLQTVVGIATDGTNLYLQGSLNNSANPPTFMLGVGTLGNLK